MRKLTIISAALLLAGCAAPAHEPPAEQAKPVTHYSDSELSTPPVAGPNTITITATTSTPGQAHWGDADTGNVTELPAGVTWSETVEDVDASEHWSVNVIGDMVSRGAEVSCTIVVDGQVVSEETGKGQGASAYCSVGELSF